MSVNNKDREVSQCVRCGRRASRFLWCDRCWSFIELEIELEKLDLCDCIVLHCDTTRAVGFTFCEIHLREYAPRLGPLLDHFIG